MPDNPSTSHRPHRRRAPVSFGRALSIGFLATFGSGVVVSACSAKATAVGPGGECFLATDCAPGLVCVEQANKTRICSDDLNRVAGRTPPDGAAAEQDGSTDGASTDGPVTPRDSGVRDTSAPLPDTGGPPPPDAGEDV